MDRRRLSVCGNFASYTNSMGYINQPITEHRRLSDGPTLRLPNHNLYYPGEYSGSETCMLKQKNSSLTMLLDSTNSIMRTASTTFQNIFGSFRRSSYCGEPDPTIQLSPNGNCGSILLISNSNESSLSNLSNDEQRRTVTIYDGRIPTAPLPPTIPFELMTPIDAITQAIDDPVESFVQIVLEEPDDRPPILPPLSSSRRNSPSRHRYRNSSSNLILTNGQLNSDKKLTDTKSLPDTQLFNSSENYCQIPKVIEPMDFSFLDPVLRGESAAPPPIRSQKSLINETSSIDDLHSPSHIINDDRTSSIENKDFNSLINPPSSKSRLNIPSSID